MMSLYTLHWLVGLPVGIALTQLFAWVIYASATIRGSDLADERIAIDLENMGTLHCPECGRQFGKEGILFKALPEKICLDDGREFGCHAYATCDRCKMYFFLDRKWVIGNFDEFTLGNVS